MDFVWTNEQQVVFENLKANKPVLKIFNPSNEMVVTTDASERTISDKLTQDGYQENCQKQILRRKCSS